MVFEESTFVLTKAPAKAAAEVTEPVVPDPSKKLDIPQRPAPSLNIESVNAETEHSAAVKTTAKPAASPVPRTVESSKSIQQTPPKREPRRPQWDTSLVNKARNAVRKPHQPQWSPAGAAARKVRPDSANSVSSWTPPRENCNFDPNKSPARSGGSPVKHPSPWTLEGGSVLDRTDEDEGIAAEEARKESAGEDPPKKPNRQELRAQALEKGWVGNGTGRQIGDQDDEEDATPRADLKKHSPTQRFGSIEGIIRTFTGDGPEGMGGHGKHSNGMPSINCRAGGADEDRAGARAQAAPKEAAEGPSPRAQAALSCERPQAFPMGSFIEMPSLGL